ncbi:TMEM175 family protein [Agrilactobacillus yilanensis]|uniref:TMEM175 family protein n=1 Tax=Agrilactobacillus yilanensis TaxID=2485997 RepID=A0ABW4J7F1_9LACO|nr:TMEM175 family protein [Agrilactobacillus yilanensis]
MFRNSHTRMTALSDGVFAIVLTIMILNITPPKVINWSKIEQLITELSVYFISFGVVAQYWIFHQELLSHLKRPPTKFLILNMYYLCLVCLTPFATTLLSDDLFSRFNTIFFAAIILSVDFVQFILFRLAIGIWQDRGITPNLHDLEEYRSTIVMFILSILYVLTAILFPPALLIIIFAGFFIRSALSRYIRRRAEQKETSSKS